MQFGFRKYHSTDTACCHLIENIKQSLDTGGVVGAIFLDLRRAFDTVNHETLFTKLDQFRLSTNTLNWLKSFLTDRTQCVKINNLLSTSKPCNIGLPQGSTLGPVLFTLYINDLPTVCDNVKIQMYADDTIIYTHGKNMTEVADKLTAAMGNVADWLKKSCLTLNLDKTAAMFFTIKSKNVSNPIITVNGDAISNVSEFKYLGRTLDSSLSFKKHVKKMSNTLKYNLATFRNIRNSLTLEAAKCFLNTIIIPYFTYCISSWSQANNTTLKPLETLYKRALSKSLIKKLLYIIIATYLKNMIYLTLIIFFSFMTFS